MREGGGRRGGAEEAEGGGREDEAEVKTKWTTVRKNVNSGYHARVVT